MDNVVQNININDIIPSKYQPTTEEKRKIEELAQMAKSFGLLDPIVVRPKNGKYEIVLGFEKYEAAKLAHLNKVPVLIKEVTDDVLMQYKNIDNNINQNITPPPKETFSNNKKNNDVISLKELSKERIEYERDDFKMNNDMLNNNLGQGPVNPNPQGPTFGGKFFPSLEDEPTNMNMMGGINPPTPGPAPVPNNNLIDLTDLTPEKEAAPATPVPDFSVPSTNLPPMNNAPTPNISVPTNIAEPAPTTDNVLNVSNLQNNIPMAPVTSAPEPVSMETLQADFGGPATPPVLGNVGQPASNEFNIPQNIGIPNLPPQAPSLNPAGALNEAPVPTINQPILDNSSLNQDPVTPSNLGPVPEFNTPPIASPSIGPDISINPIPSPAPSPISGSSLENNSTSKDVAPVVSCLKAITSNLELLGYKINVNEENLPTMTKLTIEIEK